jgi:COP9 signalosome complex subunit 3
LFPPSKAALLLQTSDNINISTQDNNAGLVLQVLRAFERHSVLKLGSTFAAVTMTDIPPHSFLSAKTSNELERYVMSLVVRQNISATLLQPANIWNPTMLRFRTATVDPSSSWETSIRDHLFTERQKIKNLNNSIQGSDIRLEVSREYLDYLRKNQKRRENNSKDGVALAKVGEQDVDVDEDMMSDLR